MIPRGAFLSFLLALFFFFFTEGQRTWELIEKSMICCTGLLFFFFLSFNLSFVTLYLYLGWGFIIIIIIRCHIAIGPSGSITSAFAFTAW